MKQAWLCLPPSSSLAVIQASCTRARTRRKDVALTHGLISHLQSGQLSYTLQHCLSVVTHGYYTSAKSNPLSLAQLWRGIQRRLRQDAPQGCLKLQTIYEFNQDIMNYLGLIIFSKCRWLWDRSDTVCNFSVTQCGYCQAMLFTFIACFCYGGFVPNFMNNRLS